MLLNYVGELKSKCTTNYHQYTAYRFINEKFPQSAHTGKQKKEILQKYARLLVRVGLNVQRGQTLVISCPVEWAFFARVCAQGA